MRRHASFLFFWNPFGSLHSNKLFIVPEILLLVAASHWFFAPFTPVSCRKAHGTNSDNGLLTGEKKLLVFIAFKLSSLTECARYTRPCVGEMWDNHKFTGMILISKFFSNGKSYDNAVGHIRFFDRMDRLDNVSLWAHSPISNSRMSAAYWFV